MGGSLVETRRVIPTIDRAIEPQQAVFVVTVMLHPRIRKPVARLKPLPTERLEPAVNL